MAARAGPLRIFRRFGPGGVAKSWVLPERGFGRHEHERLLETMVAEAPDAPFGAEVQPP